MFNLSGSEVIIILILALVILGPDKLPDAMRRAGRTWAELRKLSSGFQEEVRKGFEEPTKEVRQTADAVRKAAAFPNPLGTAKSQGKKLRYNPLKDPPPELPEGESVAEADPGEVSAGEPPAEVTDGDAAAVPTTDEVSPSAEAQPTDEPDEAEPRQTTDGSPAAS